MGKVKIKHILLLLALALAMSCASAQRKSITPNTNLKAHIRLLRLPQDLEFKKDTTGFSKFKNSKFYAKNGDADVFSIDVNKVHLIDFNNDGLQDIVYQEKQLYLSTVLFANNGKEFVEI